MRDDCIVRFVDIGEIVDPYRLNFLFIICVIKFISEVLTVCGFFSENQNEMWAKWNWTVQWKELGLLSLTPLSAIFQLYRGAVSIIGGENRRKPPTC